MSLFPKVEMNQPQIRHYPIEELSRPEGLTSLYLLLFSNILTFNELFGKAVARPAFAFFSERATTL